MRTDKERMDWLQENLSQLDMGPGVLWILGGGHYAGETLREAIDKAMGPPAGESAEHRVFLHWLRYEQLVRHRSMTGQIRKAIKARLGDYSEQELCRAIDRYGELVKHGRAPGFNAWGIHELMSRGSGCWIARMLDPAYGGIVGNRDADEIRRKQEQVSTWVSKD